MPLILQQACPNLMQVTHMSPKQTGSHLQIFLAQKYYEHSNSIQVTDNAHTRWIELLTDTVAVQRGKREHI